MSLNHPNQYQKLMYSIEHYRCYRCKGTGKSFIKHRYGKFCLFCDGTGFDYLKTDNDPNYVSKSLIREFLRVTENA